MKAGIWYCWPTFRTSYQYPCWMSIGATCKNLQTLLKCTHKYIKEKLSSPIEWSLSNGERSRNLFQKCNCNRHKYKYFRPKRKFEFRDFMAACSGKFQMIHNFPICKMKNGGSNQVVLKLIKFRKKNRQMRLLNKLCYHKEVIKNREKKKLFL